MLGIFKTLAILTLFVCSAAASSESLHDNGELTVWPANSFARPCSKNRGIF